jgi:hypothetical protein
MMKALGVATLALGLAGCNTTVYTERTIYPAVTAVDVYRPAPVVVYPPAPVYRPVVYPSAVYRRPVVTPYYNRVYRPYRYRY